MKALLFTLFLCLSFAGCNKNDSPTATAIDGDNHITSNYKFNQIDSYAKNEDNSLRLKFISSDNVSYDGYSNSWSYKYSKMIDSPAYYYIDTKTSNASSSIKQTNVQSVRIKINTRFT